MDEIDDDDETMVAMDMDEGPEEYQNNMRGRGRGKDNENPKRNKSNNDESGELTSSKKIRPRISRNDPERELKSTVNDILDDLEKLIDQVISKVDEEEKIDTGITLQTSEITVSGSTEVNENGDFPTKEIVITSNTFPIV
jgi:hypothetical protein